MLVHLPKGFVNQLFLDVLVMKSEARNQNVSVQREWFRQRFTNSSVSMTIEIHLNNVETEISTVSVIGDVKKGRSSSD